MPKLRVKKHGDSRKQGTCRLSNSDGDGKILSKNVYIEEENRNLKKKLIVIERGKI